MVKALVTTLPKSGTHLLNVIMHGLGLHRHHCPITEATVGLLDSNPDVAKASVQSIGRMLREMPDDSFVMHHVPYTKQLMFELEQIGVRPIALVRNPLDFVVSLSHHLRASPAPDTPGELSLHQLQHWISNGGSAVDGVTPEPPVAKRYFRILHGWTTDQRALLLRFEDIVGARGGGRFSDQIASGLALRDFLGVDVSAGDLARVLVGSFRPGIALFRKGQIGSWRDEMRDNTAEQIRILYKNQFANWGYDQDGALLHHAGDRPDIVTQLDAAIPALIMENALLRTKLHRVSAEIEEDVIDGDVEDDD